MANPHADRIEGLLRFRGPLTAAELATALAVSQPTVSRALASFGDHIVRIGRARATRYALAHDVGRAGNRWPLYRIDADAHPQRLGEMRALHGDGFHFEPSHPLPAFLHGDFADGLYTGPGLPWFLDDQRPQGFLGRAFARRIAADLGAPNDLTRWQPDDVVLALLRHGDDAPGDLVLGETSLQRALATILNPTTIDPTERDARYPQLAASTLQGENVGSSAAGEQPKFAITLNDGDAHRAVIVKFSERSDTRAGRRWADLLICEHLAGVALRAHGISAAENDIVAAGGRTFLESTRFDRTPLQGRRGLVSLAALDAAYYGHVRIDWWRFAPELERDGWLGAEDARRLRRLGLFGALIANTDMHLGNISLILADERPLALAPAYDMLPMYFRPAESGEVITRTFTPTPPLPEDRDDWQIAAAIANDFWRSAADDDRISQEFRAIANDASAALERTIARVR